MRVGSNPDSEAGGIVLVLVLVIEKQPLRCHADRNRTVAERSGPLVGVDGQQIEHEQEPEHEHDSPNFGVLRWSGLLPASPKTQNAKPKTQNSQAGRLCYVHDFWVTRLGDFSLSRVRCL